MPTSQFDRSNSNFSKPQPPKPFIGVLPFCHYLPEFTPRETSHGQWAIRHRDSNEQAFISAGYRDLQSLAIVWRVTTTLFEGTAEFKSYRAAERFIAVMFRCNAGRRHHAGEPQSCWALSEILCEVKCDIRRHVRHVHDLMTSLTISPLTRLTHSVRHAIAWAINETCKLKLNFTRSHSR